MIGLIIIGLYAFGKLFTDKPDTPTRAVDYATLTDQARPVAGFDLLAPAKLPEGWHANAATLNIDWWHLGIVKGDHDYIGLDQVKDTSAKRAIERFADGSRPMARPTSAARPGRSARARTTARRTSARRAMSRRWSSVRHRAR